MTAIGEEIAIAVGDKLHVGQPLGGYIAAGVLLLVLLLSVNMAWWLVTRHKMPSWVSTLLIFLASFVLSWSGMWSWWIPTILILVAFIYIALKPRQAEVVAT